MLTVGPRDRLGTVSSEYLLSHHNLGREPIYTLAARDTSVPNLIATGFNSILRGDNT